MALLGAALASLALGGRAPATAGGAGPAGPRVVLIEISGNQHTRDHVIERELLCRVGDAARELDVEMMKTRLHNIELFSAVAVEVDTVSAPGEAHVRVVVEERPSILPFPIASNSTKTGLTVGAGIDLRNFRGRHERLQLSGTGGGISGFHAAFSNPWLFWNRFSISASSGYRHEKNRYDDFTEETLSVGLGAGLSLTPDDRWRTSVGASYVSLESAEPMKTISPDNHDRVHGVGLNLTYDSRDLHRNPRGGWWIGTGVGWFGGALGGTVHYTQYLIEVRRFQPVPVGRTLGLQARLVRRAGTVPDYRLLRLGGSSSVRGYDGGDLEGEHGALAGIEYRFDLSPVRSYDLFGPLRNLDLGLSAAVFLDAGAAWNGDPELTWDDVEGSVGCGLRLLAPWVEVARLDLALTRAGGIELELGEGMKF
jgi:outer membrane protein insertion porin family